MSTDLKPLVKAMLAAEKPAAQFPPPGDFHSANTAAFFGYEESKECWANDPKRYKEEFRGVGKVSGLALVYGSSWKLFLGVVPNCTEAMAHSLYDGFFKSLPVFSAYDKQIVHDAKKNKSVMTFIKRILYIDGFDHEKWGVRAKAERQAKNLPIQGAGAEIIKFFLLRLFNYIKENNCSRWYGTYLFSDYYTRVLSIKESEITDELVTDLEACENGNCRIVVVSDDDENKVVQEFDRSVQMKISTLKKHGMKVIL